MANPTNPNPDQTGPPPGVPLSSLQNVTSPATTPPMRVHVPGLGLFTEIKKSKKAKQVIIKEKNKQSNVRRLTTTLTLTQAESPCSMYQAQDRDIIGNPTGAWNSVPKRKATKPSKDKPANQQPAKPKNKPTADDFRKTAQEGIQLDPNVSDNDDDEQSDDNNNDHVAKVLTQKTKQSSQGRRRHQHSRIESSDGEDVHSQVPKTADVDSNTNAATAPKEKNEDPGDDEPSTDDNGPLRTSDLEYPSNRDDNDVESKPAKERPQKMKLIEVANGEFMTHEEVTRVMDDYPDLMTNRDVPIHFGRKSANTRKSSTHEKAINRVFTGVSVPRLQPKKPTDRPSTSTAAADLATKEVAPNPRRPQRSTSSTIQDIMKKYPKDHGSHITPFQKRKMTRMPSTTTTIGGALGIPSLAKASLDEMKHMLAIWSRTRDDLSASMQDLRTSGYNIKTPGAYDTLDSNHSVIATFCTRLFDRIQASQASGLLNEIEVVDLDLTNEDTDTHDGLGLKRRADIEDNEDSPINSKRARSSANNEHQAGETDFLPNDKPPTIINTKTNQKSGGEDPAAKKGTTEFTVLYQNPDANPDETITLEEGEHQDQPNTTKSPPKSNRKSQRKPKQKPAITEEEKTRRKAEAQRKKEEKKNSPYKNPPNPGALLTNIWKTSHCQKMLDQYNRMLEMSRNPQWDYGPELMELVADMVTWGEDDTKPDAFYKKPELFTPSSEDVQAFSAVADPEFRHCLTSTNNDPFFNGEVFNLELLQEAFKSKADAKCSAWKALYSMAIRTDTRDSYTNDTHTEPFIAAGFRKLHTLSESCVDNLHLYINPNEVCKTDLVHYKQKTLFEAGKYVIGKIKVLNVLPATKSNNNGNGRTPNGLVVLQKRIWETLLCCLMMQNSFFINSLEDCIKTKIFPDKSMEAASKMSRYNRERSLFKEGDVKDIDSTTEMKEWGKTRLSAFGSMAVFFLFGAAGWWHCLPDSHNFNQRDVWSLVHLGHARHEWNYDKQKFKNRRRDDTPWYHIDSFVRWLLRKTNMNCVEPSEVDWESAPQFWAQHVNEKNISRLAMQDIMVEVCKAQPMKSLNFKGEDSPHVKIRHPSKELADQLKDQLRRYWIPMIDAHDQRVEDEDDQSTQIPQKPPGLPGGMPLFREPSSSIPQSQSGRSAYSLRNIGKIRTPRSKTESDEEEEEEGRSSAESINGKSNSKKRPTSVTPLSSEEESSGTDPSRDSSDDMEDNLTRHHR
ncbi:Golgi to ER traffic- protein [Puccinia graminis f. sp. tritici]|uniref:Golgi to ER traffic-protein n=1 Tax=Puccinia graminis f. sp. tritici TaxID=56615 RepID=A0A5B0MQD3_PUCGR|nr:Golgi to ER traffic- protein [Puccinia graminis f. sp. tritici]